ncbi:MAG: GntR family transcriptional regulator [Johnsonella sp.]|nr:GntR family transcriptional regulator [Johnsonella sp.]
MERHTEQPLYAQLVDKLISKMEGMQYFDKLPSERELCSLYNMSRTTVRQAMNELELGGYIIRIHGKGTFVAKPTDAKQNLSNYYSFTKQTLLMNKTPRADILEFHKEKANKSVRDKMGLKEGDKVIRFERLRLADEVPMMLETTFLPFAKFSGIKKSDLLRKPLYDIVEEDYHHKISKVVEHFSASNLSPKQAAALGLQGGLACLKVMRLSYDAKGNVVELTFSFARADQFVYTTNVSCD